MPEFTSHPQGTFSWSDLGAPNQDAAKKFYCDLFGWTFNDQPMGPDSFYTMFQKNGKTTAAVYQQSDQQKQSGRPAHWTTYIAVNNVDEAAAKAASLGATLMMPPMDVFGAGRQAILVDPTGATISLWQAREHIGASVKDEPGAVSWFELYTPDTAKAEKFYTSLLGWTSQTMPMGEAGDYTIFNVNGTGIAGMMKIGPEMAGQVPPSWTPYWGVDDVNTSTAKAVSMGAVVMVPPTPIPNIGNFAIFRDPQGVVVSILDAKK